MSYLLILISSNVYMFFSRCIFVLQEAFALIYFRIGFELKWGLRLLYLVFYWFVVKYSYLRIVDRVCLLFKIYGYSELRGDIFLQLIFGFLGLFLCFFRWFWYFCSWIFFSILDKLFEYFFVFMSYRALCFKRSRDSRSLTYQRVFVYRKHLVYLFLLFCLNMLNMFMCNISLDEFVYIFVFSNLYIVLSLFVLVESHLIHGFQKVMSDYLKDRISLILGFFCGIFSGFLVSVFELMSLSSFVFCLVCFS